MKISNKVIVLAMLFVSAGNIVASQKVNNWFNKNMNAQRGLNLDEIKIRNEYNNTTPLFCNITWKDRNGAHGTLSSSPTMKAGNNNTDKFKGPLIGYEIYDLTVYANAKKGYIKAKGNTFFVVKGNGSKKLSIVGYKNEKAYRASLRQKANDDALNDDALDA